MLLRNAESTIVGFAVAVCLLGSAVQALTMPVVTATLVGLADSATITGLSEASTLATAEHVRAYVADPDKPEPLEAVVDGREGFTDRAIIHLDDVRVVLTGVRRLTIAVGLFVTVWLAIKYLRKDHRAAASAVRVAGYLSLVLPLLAALIAVLDFDLFFAYFHKPLFEGDSWIFPADELLVQLFPESYWMLAGGALATLVVIGGWSLLLLSRIILSHAKDDSGSIVV